MIIVNLIFGFLLVFAGRNLFWLCVGGVGFLMGMVKFGVGFLGGGYLFMNIVSPAALQDLYSWLIFMIGGIVGMCLMVIAFDWTLILISSILGATLIVHAVYGEQLRAFLFIGSMVTGILVQYLTKGSILTERSI